ncbi:Zn-dependent protease with chaperone function [Pedobacter cryoconitis]|uniref:M48 family metallopeptidase n=1 Tax=Pedobacter cryoconitis TaxID=188932 RepID=UPI00160A434B|nr:M48 family metalloprotease [Pedobacter cryoconitis]MBB6272402.1 Zn-dependent protease with chaperone function [Pedobacter cryoconitis]
MDLYYKIIVAFYFIDILILLGFSYENRKELASVKVTENIKILITQVFFLSLILYPGIFDQLKLMVSALTGADQLSSIAVVVCTLAVKEVLKYTVANFVVKIKYKVNFKQQLKTAVMLSGLLLVPALWIPYLFYGVLLTTCGSLLIQLISKKNQGFTGTDLSPLMDSELRNAINAYTVQANAGHIKIFQYYNDEPNAHVVSNKEGTSLILSTRLIHDFTVKEIISVVSHEIGHEKRLHTPINKFIRLSFDIALILIGYTILKTGTAAGLDLPIKAILILSAASPLSTLKNILISFLTRQQEFQADRFSARSYSARMLISALVKLKAYHKPNHHKLIASLLYSTHPSNEARIHNLKKSIL